VYLTRWVACAHTDDCCLPGYLPAMSTQHTCAARIKHLHTYHLINCHHTHTHNQQHVDSSWSHSCFLSMNLITACYVTLRHRVNGVFVTNTCNVSHRASLLHTLTTSLRALHVENVVQSHPIARIQRHSESSAVTQTKMLCLNDFTSLFF